MKLLQEAPHRRFNPMTGEWVLVSPHRAMRPWQGKTEHIISEERPAYDPACYLCPRNERACGTKNPDYDGPYVFTNDFASLVPDSKYLEMDKGGLLRVESARGFCRVISFSPDHSKTLPQLSEETVRELVTAWSREFAEIAEDKKIKYIQIFENKGEIMGCSNPHPHGQIWASDHIPNEILTETINQEKYHNWNGSSLLSDYLTIELLQRERIVLENEHFVALVPFWAVWPFETMIIPRRQIRYINQLTAEEQKAFAWILKALTIRYDNLFQTSFPYSAGIHQAPVNDGFTKGWHLHMHFYPPLLRSASVKKFMVGYEMLAGAQRDITPETAAERLRNVGAVHYSELEKIAIEA